MVQYIKSTNLTDELQKLAETEQAINKILEIAKKEKSRGKKFIVFHRLQDEGFMDNDYGSTASSSKTELDKKIEEKGLGGEGPNQTIVISL